MLVDFGMGTTIESFHWSGSLPQRIEQLKCTVREGAMLEAVDFSIRPDILSGPQALGPARARQLWRRTNRALRVVVSEEKNR